MTIDNTLRHHPGTDSVVNRMLGAGLSASGSEGSFVVIWEDAGAP